MDVVYDTGWFMKHGIDFNEWWDPEKFKWFERSSMDLARYCSDYIDIWWDEDKFHYKSYYELGRFCYDRIELWWDEDKWDWMLQSWILPLFCYHKFDTWWNPSKFNWGDDESFQNLNKYCDEIFSDYYVNLNNYNEHIKQYIKTIPKEKQLECTLKWII